VGDLERSAGDLERSVGDLERSAGDLERSVSDFSYDPDSRLLKEVGNLRVGSFSDDR
jgi:hypothetical protein